MKFIQQFARFVLRPDFLYVYILLAIIVPNVALCFTEHLSWAASLINVLLPLSVFGYLFASKRHPAMMTWILFPFIFLAAFQLVLLYLFGNSIIAVDMFLNLVTTNASEAMELLDNLIPAVFGVFVLYIPALVIAGILVRRKGRLTEKFAAQARKISLFGLGCSVGLLALTYAMDDEYEAKVDLFPVNVCYNCYLAVERTKDVANYPETSKDFTFHAQPTHPKDSAEIYLFVIGETGRACNWGMYGYERNTTPLLQKQAGLVHFTDVLTQSNTTHKSVPMLLSLATAEDYDRIYNEKSIITAFKEAGFYTAFYSNQKYNHAFIDIFGREADETVFLKEEVHPGANTPDRDLMELVDGLLAKGHRKLFIALHTYGSHFNYKERYPDSVAVFQPDNIKDVSPKYRSTLINAYDNTIVQTDAFLNDLINRLRAQNALAAMIYTSDHGEDIFDDDRRLFLHASPVPSYYQLHVPFLVWTSDQFTTSYPQLQDNLKANQKQPVSSNASVAHTLLQLSGISTPYWADSLSLASEHYGLQKRYYINDHNLPKTYDDVGMDERDASQFALHHNVFP